jgi:hypothetical protein
LYVELLTHLVEVIRRRGHFRIQLKTSITAEILGY